MMKTEKRKANVGERILITNPELTGGNYGKGDVLTVVKTHINTVITEDNPRWIRHEEYEVIVSDKPKKSARITALETQVAALEVKVDALESAGKYPLTARFNQESPEVDAIMSDIERKAKPTSPNEQRADVIKRAKAFVSGKLAIVDVQMGWTNTDIPLYRRHGRLAITFNVNAEKRTVVAIAKYGNMHSGARTLAKGIAKCDPDDVFNADIGKAIALARALGVRYPKEFVKAVQPTEVVVGHIVKDKEGGKFAWDDYKVTRTDVKNGEIRAFTQDGMFARQRYLTITDDTDAVYE